MLKQKAIIAFLLLGITVSPSIAATSTYGAAYMNAVEIFSIPMAHAQSTDFGDTAMKFFGGLLEIFTVVNWLALAAVQALLRPEVIFGHITSSGDRPMEFILRDIWVLSRDIVNGIFAFMLIAGSVWTILSGKMDTIKTKAPQFVLAVILVNFSWFFPRVILDVANVLQATIYQVPNIVSSSAPCRAGTDPVTGAALPCNFVWKVRLFPPIDCPATAAPAACKRPTTGGTFPLRGRQISFLLDVYYTDWNKARKGKLENGMAFPVSGADVVVNGLAVNFAKLPQLARVDFQRARNMAGARPDILWKAQAFAKFFIYLVFHALLSVAIGLILLAFAAVLLVRIAMIWLCVAFMPFIFVGFAMGKPLGDLGSETLNKFNIWQKFIKYAFLPALVAVPLSVGFVLLSKVEPIAALSAMNTAGTDGLVIEGMSGIITGINNLHELLWMMLTLGIIWVGTFTVLQSEEIASKITGGIKGVGEGALKFGAKTAGYLPVLPMPGGGRGGAGILDYTDALRSGASGRGLESFRSRLSGAGTSTAPSSPPPAPPDRVRDVVQAGFNPTQFGELKQLLRDRNLQEFGEKASRYDSGHTYTPAQWRSIISHQETAQAFGEGAHAAGANITVNEVMEAQRDFQGSNTGPQMNINFNVGPGDSKEVILNNFKQVITSIPNINDEMAEREINDLASQGGMNNNANLAVERIREIMRNENISALEAIRRL